MANQVTSSASVPAFITKADITSNQGGKTAGLVNGVVRLQYFESILQDTIKATVIYADSGDSVDGKSVIEGLPLVGTEDFRLEFADNNENKIKVDLNVNSITPIIEDGMKNMISLNLVSEEFIRNEAGTSRLIHRYDGKISDHIESIVKRILLDKWKEFNPRATFTSSVPSLSIVGLTIPKIHTIRW